MSWAEALATACEDAYATSLDHVATHYLAGRGAPSIRGLGVGVWPELPYPEAFTAWARKFQWTGSVIGVLRTWTGDVSGFIIRHTTQKAYYRYELFDGRSTFMAWGLDVALPHAWATRHLIVTEGLFDALAVRYAGGVPVLATLGAAPTQLCLRWIARLALRVTVLTDMDAPGRQIVKRYQAPGRCVSAPVYNAHDPWDLWVQRPEALRALVQS